MMCKGTKAEGIFSLREAVAVKHPVIQQVSSESSGGRRQGDKILITAEAQQLYLLYRSLLTLTHPDNDPLSTGITTTFLFFSLCFSVSFLQLENI